MTVQGHDGGYIRLRRLLDEASDDPVVKNRPGQAAWFQARVADLDTMVGAYDDRIRELESEVKRMNESLNLESMHNAGEAVRFLEAEVKRLKEVPVLVYAVEDHDPDAVGAYGLWDTREGAEAYIERLRKQHGATSSLYVEEYTVLRGTDGVGPE